MSKWIQSTIAGRLALAACTLVAAGQVGCDNSCYSDLTCPRSHLDLDGGAGTGGTGGSTEIPCPDDPIDGPVAEGCGVWVSASLGNDANPGTQAQPVKTIGAAVGLAVTGPRRVYACNEVYEEAVALPAGVSLFGGFECAANWAFVGKGAAAKIAPPLPGVALRLEQGDGLSLVRDVDVTARDATAPGDSSIAVFALPGAMADIRRAYVTAGNGARGKDGEDAKNNGTPAKKGIDGLDGVDACAIGFGGPAVFLQCDGGSSMGGEGGKGGDQFANAGADGIVAPAPNPQGFGLGGFGEAVLPCTGGLSGAQGADGAEGHGSISKGHLTPQGYVGAAGEDGQPGWPGQGGGGGGASRGKATCGGAPHFGPGGGSGGSGGAVG